MGDFNLYANISLLDASYTRGALEGITPQYAPKSMARFGVIYNKEDQLKIALMGVTVSRHYANDNNGRGANENDFEIPSYTVFDLTADWGLSQNWILSTGINNLLDQEYYSRIRTDGVIWALDRNYYAGMTYKF